MSMNQDQLREALRKAPNHPRAHHIELSRLTDAGNGIVLWAHQTKHSLADVMRENGSLFFMDCSYSLRQHDRVLLTCSMDGAVEYADLVVTDSAAPVVELAILQRYPVERD